MSTKFIKASSRLQVPFDRGVDYYLPSGEILEVPTDLAKQLMEANPRTVETVKKADVDQSDESFNSKISTLFVEVGQARTETGLIDTSREILEQLQKMTAEGGPLLEREEKIANWTQYLRRIEEDAGKENVSFQHIQPSDDIAGLFSRLIELLGREIEDEKRKFTL